MNRSASQPGRSQASSRMIDQALSRMIDQALSRMIDQAQDLRSRLQVVTENPTHSAGQTEATWFTHPAHRHAAVRRFADDGYTTSGQPVLNQIGDGLGHSLLDLRTSRDFLHDACQLAQTDHFATRQVGDVGARP